MADIKMTNLDFLDARENAMQLMETVNKLNSQKNLTDNIREIFKTLGEDVNRDGLVDSPKRIIKAWYEMTWGLRINEDEFLDSISTSFDISYDEMVTVADISFTTLCEHHWLPFMGKASIGYIPNTRGKVLGISKLARIVEYYAARPQVQERLTCQVADAMLKLCNPLGVGVYMKAEHTCMTCRGVKATGSSTITTALRGAIKNCTDTRFEFLQMVK